MSKKIKKKNKKHKRRRRDRKGSRSPEVSNPIEAYIKNYKTIRHQNQQKQQLVWNGFNWVSNYNYNTDKGNTQAQTSKINRRV